MDLKQEIEVQEQEHEMGLPAGTQVWFSDIEQGSSWLHLQQKVDKPASSGSSQSPNDPLNWPSWQRDALLFAVGFCSFLSAALTPILATGFPEIADAFDVPERRVSLTIGIYMLGLGAGAVFLAPTAALFGRRPVYVAGSILLIATSAWAAASPSFASLLVARLFQGFASSPGEFLVSVTISEIYQPQERGFRLGIYMLLLAAGKSLSPLIGAGVIQRLGWRWVMWISAMASSLCFACIFTFAKETYWARDDRKELTPTPRTPGQIYTDDLSISPPLRFSQTLSLYNGRLSDKIWLPLLIKPITLLKSLPLLWSAAIYALSLGWLAVLAETIAHLFQSVSGYGFTPIQTGLLYISPLIGTILGSVVGGKVSDILACIKAYRNGGIYEPEFRLVMIVPASIMSVAGLAGYGASVEHHTHWIVPTVCFGAIYFGCILGSTIAVTYCLDAHKRDAIGAQVVLSLVKNCHGLAFSLFVVDWLRAVGARGIFLAVSGIHLAFLIMTTPMIMYGKRIRGGLSR
ncbi:major facilitator superfamily domain-containing protein [Aspergillus venezuelensis]